MSTPLTILGGYLGAGKTTLINRLLAEPHGRKLTILVNDFGAINIDAGLIDSHDGETISLTNGCACCQLRDDMIEQLSQLARQKTKPEHIIIEASGAGEPGRLAYLGYGIDGLQLESVLVAVDASTVAQKCSDKFVGKLVQRQMAQADMILLTKADSTEDDGAKAGQMIDQITVAPRLNAHHQGLAEIIFERPRQHHRLAAADGATPADDLFEQLSFTCDSSLPVAAFEALLAEHADKLARAKGHTGTHRLQLVGAKYTLVAAEKRPCALVFIAIKGQGDLQKLEMALQALTAEKMVGPAGLEPATKPL